MNITGGRLAFAAAVLIGMMAGPTVGAAQSVVRGVVRSDSGGRRLFGARLTIAPSNRTAASDGQGRYEFVGLPAGTYAASVQAIGYRPLEFEVVVGAADTLEVEVRLTPVIVRLADLEARAAPPFQSAKMEELERRRQMGLGRFMTRADLRDKESLPLSSVLRTLTGVRLVVRPWMCGGGFAAATGRGGGASNDTQLYCPSDPKSLFPAACYLAVYVDGARMWAWDQPDPPNVDSYLVSSIEGIEVYRGPSELPPQFQSTGTPCGAILLWTRTGETP